MAEMQEHSRARLGWLGQLPKQVDVYEVGPRDGLQNELRTLPTRDKARLINALVAAGEKRIEVTSFVSPKWIPQLADAEELLRLVGRRDGVVFSALVPNLKGLERAKEAGLEEAAVFISASEAHSKKNINKSIAEAVVGAREVTASALQAGMRVRGYLSTVWGCPYEGDVPVERVVDICRQLVDAGIYQLSLGDTIGIGTPRQTEVILEALLKHIPVEKLALHLHDTRGTALANALVGLSAGVTTFDASIGGLGGCPYAPGAAGNLATEDAVFMLHGMGVDTGINLDRLVEAGEIAQELIGRKLAGKYLQAALGEREKKAARRAQT
ncbi:hydroxymethylglutaryl-CoA lyase [Myxococcus xanthus DK 1622]|uniref:Hydroxymethylglutaryl-CoA lyase n=1 Tax=Myxococcus xanthus (strain DK1622) TaxID=246197 RepID=Q1D5Y8_MYXXD|nr:MULTISPECIES: hydroxymethylglutaryl-CoA lyase [Myxococcus]ABF91691.1 hydroxymethylglutaryl-CoA lyase [Myxococcus xanthus DK 1622]NOJ53304.1 hydroxymethylglutaryl-CoA lyase [Myxococcus xanthus]QPM83140.1 hydroxymethylglutaryl-CoA lyase [Myxococcus xanthus]QQR48013.1 hydroxymethylglutaryl-CoA lyase [Myxococcus xanthus]QVW65446.1 hydroxymethylglutaryl-CoA lyase [Myxococcus xanthus DZ2]